MIGDNPSAPGQRADKIGTGLDCFGPVRADRPFPVVAVVVPAVIVACASIAGLAALDYATRGAVWFVVAELLAFAARWAFLGATGLALGWVLAVLVTRGQRRA